MKLTHISKEQRKQFRELLKAIMDLLIHFSMTELQELHDKVEQWNSEK